MGARMLFPAMPRGGAPAYDKDREMLDMIHDGRIMIEERKVVLEEKKVALEEKRVKIAVNAEDAKMLTLNIDSLDVDARIIVQSVRYQMLEWQKNQLTTAQDEDATEAEVDAHAEATYVAVAAPP